MNIDNKNHIHKMSESNHEENDLIDLTNYDEEDHVFIEQYLGSLNSLEKQALIIARDHLKSSFNIVKSIGFQKWKKNL